MKRLITLLSLLIIAQWTFGQLSGNKYVPGDYATIAAAVNALNSSGVTGGGGVTFNVAANHTESVTAPITILPTVIGSASDQIIFRKDGEGANPQITRTDPGSLSTSTIGGSGDAVIRIEGTDYITFDGIDVVASQSGIEYGYITHKPSGTNGCQFVAIKNCSIDLTKGSSAYVIGIYIGNGTTSVSAATGVTVTANSGKNSDIEISGNTIRDAHAGIYVRGGSAASYYDNNIVIGKSGAGNNIQNFGGGSATTTYGVYFIYVNNPAVEYNVINNAGSGGSNHGATLYGVFYSTVTGDVKGNNNQITMANSSASSATQYLYNGNTVTSNNFNNNTFGAGTISSTGTIYFVYASSSTLNTTVYGNQTSGIINRTGASGTFYCYYNFGSPASGAENFYNNTFNNITVAGSTTFYGYQSNTASGHTQNVYGNTFSNINLGTGTFYGLSLASANTRNVYDNSIYNIASSGTLYGISSGSGANPGNVYNNEIYNMTSQNTSAVVDGIYITSGTALKIYNNFIYRLYAPLSGSTTGIAGIYISGGTAINVYYNSIYLDATSSGANFGTIGIYASVTPTVELRNNVVVNNSVANGTGFVVAYRRSANTPLTTYSSTSDNNDFYAGTPSPTNLIYYDGTTPQITLADYKTLVAPRDAASFSENAPFAEVAVAPYNLHMKTTVATQCEGGGSVVAGISDDIDGDERQNPPDVGADEFEGTPLPLCEGIPETSIITGLGEVCYNTGTILELSKVYEDMGIFYLWGYSIDPGGPYTNLGTASTQSTGNLTETAYYICTVTCAYSEESMTTAEFTITINPLPEVHVSPTSGSYCTPGGTPLTLTASGATTYSWSPASGLDATIGSVVNASPSSTTTYTVTGTDDNGCSNTATVTVTVGTFPIISSVTATPEDICPNGSAQLNVVAIGPGPASQYGFAASSGTFSPLSGGTVVSSLLADDAISAAIPIGFGFNFSGNSYSNVYASSNGFLSFNSAATNAASNSLNAPTSTWLPLIAPMWDDLDGRATGGSNASYYTTPGPIGNRVFTFEWLNYEWNYTSTSAVISFQVKLYEADHHIEFIYRQEAGAVVPGTTSGASIGLAGTSVGNFLSLDGTGTSPNASNITANNTLLTKPATGQVYTFTMPVSSSYTYSWSPADGLTPGADVANPVTPALGASTEYTVTVSNGGCSVQGSVTVSLADLLEAFVTSPTRCTGDVTTPITGSHSGGSPDFTFTWSPVNDLFVDAEGTDDYDGSALDSPVIYTKAYTPTTYYLLTVTDGCGSTATATSTVTVYQTPTASASSNSAVCTGETLELYGSSDLGTVFSWTGPNGFISDQQNPAIPDVTMAANGTYYFIATANGCPSATASVDVVVNQTPSELFVTPDNAMICPGSVQQLVASGGLIPEEDVILLAEDFNGDFIYGWTQINESTGGDDYTLAAWNIYISGGSIISNDNSNYVMSNSDAQGQNGQTHTKLMTPVLNTLNFTSLTLSFWHNFNWWSSSDSAKIEVSTNGGVSWLSTPVISYINGDQGTGTSWVNANIDLSAYVNQPDLQIRFRYKAVWGFYWAIDNVNIYGDKLMPSEVTWLPYNDLFLDAEATEPYAGEDAPTVYSKMYTTRTYTATATSLEGCSISTTATVTGVDYTVSGTLKYNNNPKTPMNNVTLTLNPGGHTAITDGTGAFSFFDICEGDYTISVSNINKPVGGINSTDAVQMNVWNANQGPIQHVKFLAGEVDFDGSVFINATDALSVQNYFVFATPFNRADAFNSPWVFWKAGEFIMNNNDLNRFMLDIPVEVVASDVTVDMYGQAIGDFSGSFTPGGLKGASTSLDLVYVENRIAGKGVAINLPVRMIKSSSVSAVSLVLDFPSDLLEITGITMSQTELQPTWSVNGNELRIGWHSTQAMWLKANEELLTIHIVTSNAFNQGDMIRFSLASDPLNEMADGAFEVIPDAIIGTDIVEFSTYGIGDPSDGNSVSLKVSPNPFANYTTLTYGLPVNGHVTLKITDMLGRVISLPVDQYQNSGTYSVKLDALPLQSGVYTATISFESTSGNMTRTIKLIRK